MPFREAHGRVGKLVKFCSSRSCQLRDLNTDEISEMLGVAVSKTELNSILDPIKTLQGRKVTGSPNPRLVSISSKKRLEEIAKHENTLQTLQKSLAESQKLLWSSSESIEKASGSKHAVNVSES
jgi:hypothetical protein